MVSRRSTVFVGLFPQSARHGVNIIYSNIESALDGRSQIVAGLVSSPAVPYCADMQRQHGLGQWRQPTTAPVERVS